MGNQNGPPAEGGAHTPASAHHTITGSAPLETGRYLHLKPADDLSGDANASASIKMPCQTEKARHTALSQVTSNSTAFLNSRQISWWSVHEFVQAVLDQVNNWPMPGTPAWCLLAADDPRKWAALLDAAQHHALRLELNQRSPRGCI